MVSSDIQTKHTGPGHWKEKTQIKDEANTQHSLSTYCMQCAGNANKTNAQPQTLKKPEGGIKSRTTLLTAAAGDLKPRTREGVPMDGKLLGKVFEGRGILAKLI